MKANERIIVALDFDDRENALSLVDNLGDWAAKYKVGYRLLTGAGFEILDELVSRGKWVFCDMKLHDIPTTVSGAVRNLAAKKIGSISLHVSGGSAMLKAAAQAIQNLVHRPQLWGITVLTSLDDFTVQNELLVNSSAQEFAVHLARIARFCGCDGVVASGNEVERIKESCGEDFIVAVPGVRPSWSEQHDQKRTITPQEAIKLGADFIIVGRAIAEADEPLSAFLRILDEIT
ncbi:MAG: orotidine-5'-phosphate decarboxylase [Armatimonadetes bacterium]|nr:orotidine-5'-phosphate decarboxylase [Armatimonadota bacterium]MDW8027503.1 orotidine-5'-phosphate decarboxylase [Armatimonadota bacterium]